MSSDDLDPGRFATHRAQVRGVELAYVHENPGGVPILLVHGWPGSKRLYWRAIQPLADAGFEVICPDQRGFNESSVVDDPAEYPDTVRTGRDFQALLEHLGIDRAVLVGGDFGCGVVQDMALRFDGLALRQVCFNGTSPVLPELYAEHGITGDQLAEITEVSNHLKEHGFGADALAAELTTPEARRSYVEGFYLNRVWKQGGANLGLAAQGGFDERSAAFMSEPFGDAVRFRTGLGLYEGIMDPEKGAELPRLMEVSPVRTLILYGVEDRIVGPKFAQRMALACPDHEGPVRIEGAGHFLQWERPDAFVAAIRDFCADLL